jgi:integrase/recombinase XerD
MALRRFSVWLVEEGKLPADPLVGLKPPQLDQQLVPGLSEDEIRRLLRACEGKSLRDRRDEAIIRLLLETDLRVGECLALTVDDVDVRGGLVLVRRGKGGKGRVVPFGPVTGRALDRYLRLRRGHPLAHSDALWLGSAATASAMTPCTTLSPDGAGWLGWCGSPHSSCATPSLTDGWPPRAARWGC